MAVGFQRRRIRVTIQLASGTFSKEGDPDTVVLEDYRTQVEIHAAGGFQLAECRMRIYGVSQDSMNRMTVINYQNLDYMRNVLKVEATDDSGQFVTIFIGIIIQAHAEYAGAPDVPFVCEASSGMLGKLSTAAAQSYPGPRKVSEMMGLLATELDLQLENNGVETTLTDQYLAGPPLYKVQSLAAMAGIQYWYLPEQGVLAIAPMGRPRETVPAVRYNISTGLVGWPTKLHVGIAFTALFSPQISHGCKIVMESSVPACNGQLYIITINHRLDAMMPGGAWFTDFIATPENTFVRAS